MSVAAIVGGRATVEATEEEFARFVQAEIAKWAKVIRDAHVTLN